MKPYEIIQGDCLDVMANMDSGSADTIISDPPYGLSFMGKEWDHGVPGVPFWEAALRVAKPGAILMAFGGTRTHHRLMCAIEDAGWEIRDCIMWLYAQGFPKSLDISKAIDKAAGAEREVVGPKVTGDGHIQNRVAGTNNYGTFKMSQDGLDMETAPATAAAQQWHGYGTALKPAWEPVIVAMKPVDGTFANNALQHGVAGFDIDGGRIAGAMEKCRSLSAPRRLSPVYGKQNESINPQSPLGRFPANVIHDGSDEVTGEFPETSSGAENKNTTNRDNGKTIGNGLGNGNGDGIGGDSGSAARFFYCAKPSQDERNAGTQNVHPTVKPLSLMRYLCKLTKTPTGGIVLDPFMGSGTTGIAALLEDRKFIGIELQQEYCDIADARIRESVGELALAMMEDTLTGDTK